MRHALCPSTSRGDLALHGEEQSLPGALCADPSPAADDVLETPTLINHTSSQPLMSPWQSRSDAPDPSADALAALPGFVKIQPLQSPPCNLDATTNMNTIVGGALAPVHDFAAPQSRPRCGPGLRLPSFESLGIASPHPDRCGPGSVDGTHADPSEGTCPHAEHCWSMQTHTSNGLLAGSVPVSSPTINHGKLMSSPLRHHVDVLTPPAEGGATMWSPSATVITHAMQSPSLTADHIAVSQESSPAQLQQAAAGQAPSININPSTPDELRPWIDGAIQATLENLRTSRDANGTVRILSHALPCPSEAGHIFPTFINSIHDSTPSTPTVWINVFHAVPGRFNLADLPTSPPSTPGPSVGAVDYFTQKVFDSAVQISDYQDDLSSLPKSPRPVVPPSSINVSIVERYIPPTNAREFATMFDERGPSILIDRLVELSPSNGTLVFVYPTKAGAQTFMNEYLSPILDPLLRSMVVTNGLSHDLSPSIGRMTSVDTLPTHETLKRRIQILCAQLTQRSHSLERFHGRRAAFHVMYSGKKEVMLDRDVWAKDWWTRQEKAKIRTVVTRYANEAMAKKQNVYASQDRTSTHLIQELLDGVTGRPYTGEGPTQGVEVSVFVIKRSE